MGDLSLVYDFTRKAEGEVRLSNGCHQLYQCPAKKWTIGYGYNIQDNGLPENIAEMLLKRCLADSEYILSYNIKNWQSLGLTRQSVLIDMVFNLGWPAFSGFKKTIAAVESEDFKEAAKQMKDSRWYRQVGKRAKLLVSSMESGQWNVYS